MSLINDALQRAKQTQQQNPPPTPPLQFRPVEPAPPNHRRAPLLFVGLVLALILVVALGGLVVWFVAQKSNGELRAAARTVNEPVATLTADSPVASIPTPAPAPASKVEPSLATAPVESETNTVAVTTTVEPPKPLAPKLQGIAFHPIRPSAVVNGKNVFIGDRVSEFRVLAITRGSVTLGSATATNVLSLSE